MYRSVLHKGVVHEIGIIKMGVQTKVQMRLSKTSCLLPQDILHIKALILPQAPRAK
jgi:hypothetical protein